MLRPGVEDCLPLGCGRYGDGAARKCVRAVLICRMTHAGLDYETSVRGAFESNLLRGGQGIRRMPWEEAG